MKLFLVLSLILLITKVHCDLADLGLITEKSFSDLKSTISSAEISAFSTSFSITRRFDDAFVILTNALQAINARHPSLAEDTTFDNALNNVWEQISGVLTEAQDFLSTEEDQLFYAYQFTENLKFELDGEWLPIRTSIAPNMQTCVSSNYLKVRSQISNGFQQIKNCLKIFTENVKKVGNLFYYKLYTFESAMTKLGASLTPCSSLFLNEYQAKECATKLLQANLDFSVILSSMTDGLRSINTTSHEECIFNQPDKAINEINSIIREVVACINPDGKMLVLSRLK